MQVTRKLIKGCRGKNFFRYYNKETGVQISKKAYAEAREGNTREGNTREGNTREGNTREGTLKDTREGNTREGTLKDTREVDQSPIEEELIVFPDQRMIEKYTRRKNYIRSLSKIKKQVIPILTPEMIHLFIQHHFTQSRCPQLTKTQSLIIVPQLTNTASPPPQSTKPASPPKTTSPPKTKDSDVWIIDIPLLFEKQVGPFGTVLQLSKNIFNYFF